MRRWRIVSFLLLALIWAPSAHAVEPDEILDDPVLEARARDISANLRCVVCQNQSIDESAAAIAKDLRLIVRERLVAGDNNDQVYSFITDRYGDYVLLYPPLKPQTLILWFGPLFLLLIGAWLSYRYIRSAGAGTDEPAAGALSPEEENRLKVLLDDGESA